MVPKTIVKSIPRNITVARQLEIIDGIDLWTKLFFLAIPKCGLPFLCTQYYRNITGDMINFVDFDNSGFIYKN